MLPRPKTLAQKAKALGDLADELGLVDPEAGFLDPAKSPAKTARPKRTDIRHPVIKLGSGNYPIDLT
jgi:hypothetical protein